MPRNAGNTLLPIARASIAQALGQAHQAAEEAEWLREPGATFVTLRQCGQLRGCIGTLEACRSLLMDVKTNAVAAALRDPRFAPLTAAELAATDIEVSLLSPMQAMDFDSEAQALQQLRPGVDGLVFEFGRYRSTFLPQVWEQLPNPPDFIAHLKHKAGLPVDFWAEGVRLQRYSVSKWRDTGGARSTISGRDDVAQVSHGTDSKTTNQWWRRPTTARSACGVVANAERRGAEDFQ